MPGERRSHCTVVRPFNDHPFVASGRNWAMGSSFSFSDVDRWEAPSPLREILAHSPLTFQERPSADIICRALDGSEVLSYKAVLAAASPVMRDPLVALVAEGPETDTQIPSTVVGARFLPVLEFPDMAGTTLSVLLELCYPGRDNLFLQYSLGSVRDVCVLVRAAERHAIGRVCDMLHRALLARIPWAPLTAYLLASHIGLGATYIRNAEQHVLGKGRPPSACGWLPEMESVNALAYHSLMVKYEDLKRSGLSEHVSCGPTAPCKRRRPGGF